MSHYARQAFEIMQTRLQLIEFQEARLKRRQITGYRYRGFRAGLHHIDVWRGRAMRFIRIKQVH